jgi:hypothetical protein
MLGNAMFSEMTNYTSDVYLSNHPYIYILTPDATFQLTALGAIKCKGTDPVRRLEFQNANDFQNFKGILSTYLVSGQYASVLSASNLFCFSTCEQYDTSSRIITIATDANRVASTDEIITAWLETLSLSSLLFVTAGSF